MKIVINGRFGGFSLSHKAFLKLREMENKYAFEEPDYGECWNDESGPKEKPAYETKGFFLLEIPRDDPDLIKVVEELGNEANGYCASLEIIEIPDDVEWEIQEYDGSEWVAEKHRTWR